MSGIYQIVLEPSKQKIQVSLEYNTTIEEIFDYINIEYKICNSYQNWTCFSSSRQKYLNLKEEVGRFLNDTLTINTSPAPSFQTQTQNHITLFINITDGHVKKAFQGKYSQNNTLDEVASSILAYCQLSKNLNVATADLFIFDQPYNDQVKRGKTLAELQIKDNLTIEAKIRWIGGE